MREVRFKYKSIILCYCGVIYSRKTTAEKLSLSLDDGSHKSAQPVLSLPSFTLAHSSIDNLSTWVEMVASLRRIAST